MSRKQAKRQRFYAKQREWRWLRRHSWSYAFPSDPGLAWMQALMGDVKRLADEECSIPLLKGEIGQLDCGFRFVEP